jgi:head-tail adaptor
MAGLLSTAEIASITATIASSLDQTLALYRKTLTHDAYGSNTEAYVSQGNVLCNIYKPTATQLQSYAGLIGSQRAVMLRVMPATDVRENDRIVYANLNWLVQTVENADSYTYATDYLMTVIA